MSMGQLTAHGDPQRFPFRTLKVRSVGGRKTQPLGKLIFSSCAQPSLRHMPPNAGLRSQKSTEHTEPCWHDWSSPDGLKLKVSHSYSGHPSAFNFSAAKASTLINLLWKAAVKCTWEQDSPKVTKLVSHSSTGSDSWTDIQEFTAACVCACICVYVHLRDWQLNSDITAHRGGGASQWHVFSINSLLQCSLRIDHCTYTFFTTICH